MLVWVQMYVCAYGGYIYMYVNLCSGGQRSASGVIHEESSTLLFETVSDQAGVSGHQALFSVDSG